MDIWRDTVPIALASARSRATACDFLHDLDLEITLGNELLQPPILDLELLQAPDLAQPPKRLRS
jgi:hypothetical protein